mgnify:CR=1 FL=1
MSVRSRTLSIVSIALLSFVLVGCNKAGKAGSDYLAAYDQGRYAEAYDSAARVADKKSGQGRESAALIAGLSAQRLGRDIDAERWLTPILQSPDGAIAGRAGAALGLMAQESGRNLEASVLLEKASTKLSGDEAARSSMYAGDSYRALGKPGEAITAYTRAQGMVQSDTQLRGMIADRMASGSAGGPGTVAKGMWAVQMGAFSTQKNAQAEAVKAARFGSPRVVPVSSSKGQRLYAVRVGAFPGRGAADSLKGRIGTTARVVQTTDE